MNKLNGQQPTSINHALQILNSAAKDSSEDIKEMIDKDYRFLKRAMSGASTGSKAALEFKEKAAERLSELKERALERGKVVAKTVDSSAHENPWYFIGGAAVVAGVLGFMMGRKSS